MSALETWKIGTTKQPYVIGGPLMSPYRYPSGKLPFGFDYEVIYSGNRLQTLFMEKYYLALYVLEHGELPPGNRVFH